MIEVVVTDASVCFFRFLVSLSPLEIGFDLSVFWSQTICLFHYVEKEIIYLQKSLLEEMDSAMKTIA